CAARPGAQYLGAELLTGSPVPSPTRGAGQETPPVRRQSASVPCVFRLPAGASRTSSPSLTRARAARCSRFTRSNPLRRSTRTVNRVDGRTDPGKPTLVITATKPTVLAGWTLESIVGSGASGHVLRVRRGEQVAAMKIAGEALEVDASALFAKEAR